MPRSVHIPVEGKRLDKRLLKALEESVQGQGDGRVSKADVETKIAKTIGHTLTDTKIATIDHAAKHVKFTTGAKDALSALAEEKLGRPAFEWQRGGTVDPRLAPKLPLTGKAIEQAATDFVLHNVEPVLGAEADKALPHLDSGEEGLSPYILSGHKQDQLVALFRELEGSSAPDVLKKFDPKKHTAIMTVGSEDETHIFLAILDKTTGKTTFISDQNSVDITSSVDEAAFTKIFGDYNKFTSDPKSPDNEYDYVDGYLLADYLEKGATPLDVPHDTDKDRALERLNTKATAVAEVFGSSSWDLPVRADAGKLPVKEDFAGMAKLMFVAGRDEDRNIDYRHDGVPIKTGARQDWMPSVVDTIAQAFIVANPKGAAALPEVKTRIKDALSVLGKASDIGLYEVTSKVKHETDPNKTTEAHTWAFINEKTGTFLALYARPDMP